MMTKINKAENYQVTISRLQNGGDYYWKSWEWDTELPAVLIIANYPTSMPLLGDDLTSLLIRNEVVKTGKYGKVIIANLFTRPVQWPSDKSLAKAYPKDGLKQLLAVAHEAHEVVIATGSLPTKSNVANKRLAQLKKLIKSEDDVTKYQLLVNDKGKAAHPLSLRSTPWQLKPWITTKVVK